MRYGGLGIADPTETAYKEYTALCAITKDLSNLILHPEQDLSLYDVEATAGKIKALKTSKDLFLTGKLEDIKSNIRCFIKKMSRFQ